MNYFGDNENFYPTPPELAAKMVVKADFKNARYVLEPSAGKGDLADFVREYEYILNDDWYLREFCHQNNITKKDVDARIEAARIACGHDKRGKYNRGLDVECVELDENLRHILRGKDYRVEGGDFLEFYTEKKYDIIIMNPPFDRGDEHLLKAIRLQKRFGGEIVCLLNAETIRNPFTNSRKELEKRLKRYGAEIEFVSNAFTGAERKTGVEVAIVYINIPDESKQHTTLLDELKRAKVEELEMPSEVNDLVTSDVIQQAVIMYRTEVNAGKRIISEYEALKPFINSRISVDEDAPQSSKDFKDVPILQLVLIGGKTSEFSYQKVDFNDYLKQVRYKYWYELLHKPKFLGNLTTNLRDEYFGKIEDLANYEFNLSNIYQVKIDILQNMVRGVEDKILELFEKFTYEHSCECADNVHYFNGWKTNKAFYINKKVIVPWMRTWDDIWKKFKYNYEISGFLSDIEKTLEFLDTETRVFRRDIYHWLQHYEKEQITKNMEFNFFNVTAYKKGTLHITFTEEELLKKLNIYGCQRKGWLPPCYGKKRYSEMDDEEKAVIDEFEGEASYNEVFENKDKYLVESKSLLMLGDGSGQM